MKIQIPLHTILFSVAPSGTGKSNFFTTKLIPTLKEQYNDLNIQYISSDETRKMLLGDETIDKLDISMGYVSDLAFKLLYERLGAVLSTTVRAEIVIVDTTGLSESFIDSMVDYGKRFHYNVMPIMWSYNKREDYFTYSTNNSITAKHVKTLNEKTLQLCTKKRFPLLHKVRSVEAVNEPLEVEVLDYDFYKSHRLSDSIEYVVVSDVHGCYDELIEIMKLNGAEITEEGKLVSDKIFILQDYVDKGEQIREVVEFIYNNQDKIILLVSNHENYVYKALKGEIKPDKNLLDSYFNSFYLFQNDDDLKNKFFHLFENSRHFYYNKYFFCNHAPCEGRFLGKLDPVSLKNMRNFFYERRMDGELMGDYAKRLEEKCFHFIKRDYSYYYDKRVIWGHVAIERVTRIGNAMMIDTGVVSGGKLTALSIDAYNGKIYQKDVLSKRDKKEELVTLFMSKPKVTVNLGDLERDDLKRLKFLGLNKVNFISGTMCPGDKSDNVLESLDSALNYFKNKGIDKVILQKKYMGSSAQIYLNVDKTKCYSVSRNGFVIDRRVDLSTIYETMLNKFKPYMDENNFEMLIINGELMPWNVLGKGLIDEQYSAIRTGISTEYEILKTSGFFEKYKELASDSRLEEFEKDSKNTSKKDLVAKYSQKDFEILKNICKFGKEIVGEKEYQSFKDTFNRQLELFAQDTEMEFKPFGLLKGVRFDGTEKLYFDDSNIEIFKMISDDEYCVVDFNEESYISIAQEFYNKVAFNLEMEGIVVKPEKVYNANVAHALKVRNPNYLTLVYGYDYQKDSKYQLLINKKSVNRKLKASITEFEIGKRMLEIPYAEISHENAEFNNICVEMIIDEKKTAMLDPRL